jgi:pimeloyl-ACP methyl ester carboxylesterase
MSYGGWTALNYAMHAPERLSKLVVLSPSSGLAPFRKQFMLRLALLQVPYVNWRVVPSVLRWMCYPDSLRDEKTRTLWRRLTRQMILGARYWRIPASRTVRVPPLVFTDTELKQVAAPTLVLVGEQEALYDATLAVTRAKRRIPNIRADLIPRASHEMTVSQAEAVDRRVLRFLKE